VSRPRRRRPALTREQLVRLGIAWGALEETIRQIVDPTADTAAEALSRAMATRREDR